MTDQRQIVTPYLCCRDATRALAFYERGFGAVVSNRYVTPEGVVGHADLEVAGGRFMLSDEWPGDLGSRDRRAAAPRRRPLRSHLSRSNPRRPR